MMKFAVNHVALEVDNSVEPCDLRKGIDGYASLVRSEFHLNPMDKNLYMFCNRQHNK